MAASIRRPQCHRPARRGQGVLRGRCWSAAASAAVGHNRRADSTARPAGPRNAGNHLPLSDLRPRSIEQRRASGRGCAAGCSHRASVYAPVVLGCARQSPLWGRRRVDLGFWRGFHRRVVRDRHGQRRSRRLSRRTLLAEQRPTLTHRPEGAAQCERQVAARRLRVFAQVAIFDRAPGCAATVRLLFGARLVAQQRATIAGSSHSPALGGAAHRRTRCRWLGPSGERTAGRRGRPCRQHGRAGAWPGTGHRPATFGTGAPLDATVPAARATHAPGRDRHGLVRPPEPRGPAQRGSYREWHPPPQPGR